MTPESSAIARFKDEIDLIVKMLPLDRPLDLVELGCGAAATARGLLGRFPDLQVTGIEVDRVQMEKNRAQTIPRLEFVEAGAQAIPFEAGRFDCAMMLKSLHHVPMPLMGKALGEIARVVRTGGLLYVSEPCYGGAFNDIVRLYNDEGMVRAAAQGALDAAIAEPEPLWEQIDEVRFTMPARFENFDDFERKLMRPSYADHKLDAALVDRVREAFSPHQRADGAHFVRLMHVRLLSRTAHPAPAAADTH
jgi:SAM-dependent methyltransferase